MTGPIVVTGLPRSGTSWVGKMLEGSGDAVYVNEPLNPAHPPGRSPGVLNAEVTQYFQYICPDNEWPWVRAFRDTSNLQYHLIAELRRNHRAYDLARAAKYASSFRIGQLRGRRALLDDPYAVFAAAWLVDRLDARAVVLVRDPVAVVGSWLRLGWSVDLANLLEQPLLMRDHLEPFRDELAALAGSRDCVAATALLWRATYATVQNMARSRPALLVRRHEDFATEPVARFRQLFKDLDLTWSGKAQRLIVEGSTGSELGTGRRFAWSMRGGPSRTAYRRMDSRAALQASHNRLSQSQIDRVLELTGDVRARYYQAPILS